MPRESKPVKLWEWSNQAGKGETSDKKVSLSYPEDAQQSGTTLIPVVNKSFQGETVIIDGRNFINCEFRDCSMQWNGNDFIFTTCTFHGLQKLATPLPEIAAAMHLASVCNLLDESTRSSETGTRSKKNRD